ncbi:hypothetical protein O3M35_005412 [Rhynocoris fuscipes]|uniref:Uncharacterized protein n=1 Tax=Rhynocoris fuscipes TaxID=488301 RepID=A0AAW1DIK5_9HEMI
MYKKIFKFLISSTVFGKQSSLLKTFNSRPLTNPFFIKDLKFKNPSYFLSTESVLFSRPIPVINKHSKTFNKYLLLGTFFGLFPNSKDEENDSELITTIKRAILLIQRDEFKSAEQMLHLALKIAQEQQNEDGITYIYDLLANLAFAQGHHSKAEKLFLGVLQRLTSKGIQEDDLKINHVSLKLAKIYEEKTDFNKAEEGYKFCLKNLDHKVQSPGPGSANEDAVVLLAMTLDWYARFLLERDRLEEALNYFKKAYDLCISIYGEIHEQTVVLLNDLGTISFLKGNMEDAMDYLNKAVEIGRHLPNMEDLSSVYVNLGNMYLQKRMFDEAKKYCKEGWQNAKRHKNSDGLQEATLCLDELNKAMKV